MADSDFWRDLVAKFRALPNDYGMFCVEWCRVEDEPTIWTARGTTTTLAQFAALAVRAGAALDSESSDFRATWLDALRKESPDSRTPISGTEKRPDGTQARCVSGRIANVCEASANYCSDLEGRALEMKSQGRQRGEENRKAERSALRDRYFTVRRQLLFPVNDNYFSLSA